MKRFSSKLLAIAILTVVVIVAIGCEEQNGFDARKNKLVAEENYRLKQQTEELKAEIEKQIGLLEKCHQEKVGLEEQASESMDFLMKQLPDNIREENSQLQEEIQALKSQIEKLQSQTQKSQPPSAQ